MATKKVPPLRPAPRTEYPSWVMSINRKTNESIYRKVVDKILERALWDFDKDENREWETLTPLSKDLANSVKHIGKVIDLTQEPEEELQLLDYVDKLIEFSREKKCHIFNVSKDSGGLDPYGLMGEWLASCMINSVLSYQVGPVYTLLEYEVFRYVRQLLGYSSDGVEGDGIVPPGTSMGNGYAINLALQRKFPFLKKKGFLDQVQRVDQQPVLFVSEHAQQYIDDLCVWQGIGLESVIRVKVDQNGRMSVESLVEEIEAALRNHQIPFMVIATAGTPILGSIDPIKEIGRISKKYNLWFHIDGYLAGSMILSKGTQRDLLKGCELSDSFLWSVDKSLGAPLTASVLVTRESHVMKKAFSYGPAYLLSPNPLYDNVKWDSGDNNMQCTRRPDILKIWFMLKVKGQKVLDEHLKHTKKMTNFLVQEIERRNRENAIGSSFETILQEFESHLAAFYYIPKCIQNLERNSREHFLKESKYTEKLGKYLFESRILSISVESLPNYPVAFFVANLGNSGLVPEDLIQILDLIENHGESSAFLQRLDFPIPQHENEQGSSIEDKISESSFPKTVSNSNPPHFVNTPIKSLHLDLFRKFWDLILTEGSFFDILDKPQPAHSFKSPEELLATVDWTLGQDKENQVSIRNQDDIPKILEIVKNVIKYSGHYGDPYWLFHMIGGINGHSLVADHVITALNESTQAYDANPIFTMMEEELLTNIRKMVGYPEDGEGQLLPAGSACIQLAALFARMAKFPGRESSSIIISKDQSRPKAFVAFMSATGHFSVDKGAAFLGIGMENCVKVPVDQKRRMIPAELRKAVMRAINENKIPFFCVATSGTTVIGAVDPIDEISDICEEFGLWLHVDGSYLGGVVMTTNEELKTRIFKGVERSDSFNCNPQKLFSSVRSTAIFVTRHKNLMKKGQTFNSGRSKDQHCWDGERRWFPERRATAFKIWFQWKAQGLSGFTRHLDYCFKLTQQIVCEIKARISLHLSYLFPWPNYEPESPHINFYFVPKRLRHLIKNFEQDQEARREFYREINGTQAEIVARLKVYQGVVINDGPDMGKPSALILNFTNSALTFDQAIFILNLIEYYGEFL